ncbi:MAG: aspartyl protease family protein [Planctomycetota bacterium]|jgi:hypothetical protein
MPPRRLAAALLTIPAVAALAAPAPPPAPTAPAPPGDAAVEEAVLPTHDCGHYFIAHVEIDGRGPYPMLLDTGAAKTVIARSVARDLGVRKRIGELRIGRMSARRVPVLVRDIDHLSNAIGEEIAGVVGHPVFRGVLVTYDFPGREVRVRTGVLPAEGDGIVSTSRGPRPFIGARIGDERLAMLLDTGSSGGLDLTNLDRFAFRSGPRPCGASMRIDGLHVEHKGRLAGDVRLGPLTLRTPVVGSSASVDLVGQDVLAPFTVTFDAKHARVRFARADAPLATPLESPPYHGLGTACRPTGDALEVVRLFGGSPAGAAGVRVGDRIVAIDGTPVADNGCERLVRPNGPDDMTLLVERDGERRVVAVTKACMVP